MWMLCVPLGFADRETAGAGKKSGRQAKAQACFSIGGLGTFEQSGGYIIARLCVPQYWLTWLHLCAFDAFYGLTFWIHVLAFDRFIKLFDSFLRAYR